MFFVKSPRSTGESEAKAEPHPSPQNRLCDQENNELPGRGMGAGSGSAPLLPLPWAGMDRSDHMPSRAQASVSLCNFAISPGSLREEARAQLIPPCSGSRPDGGDERAQVLQALQQLAGEMRRLGKWAEAAGQGSGF